MEVVSEKRPKYKQESNTLELRTDLFSSWNKERDREGKMEEKTPLISSEEWRQRSTDL